jgi:acylphosphatase
MGEGLPCGVCFTTPQGKGGGEQEFQPPISLFPRKGGGGKFLGVVFNVSVMEKVRARAIIEGRVQGVFFRYHTQDMALQLGLKGWVKNRRDGRVEAVFEGNKDKVDQIIQWCHRGPSEARVTKVHFNWEDYTGEFEDFAINY